jgi:hypothetical protein
MFKGWQRTLRSAGAKDETGCEQDEASGSSHARILETKSGKARKNRHFSHLLPKITGYELSNVAVLNDSIREIGKDSIHPHGPHFINHGRCIDGIDKDLEPELVGFFDKATAGKSSRWMDARRPQDSSRPAPKPGWTIQ